MKASIITGAIAALVAVGCWFGWGAYQSHQESSQALSAVQASAALFERQISARNEDGITLAEYSSRASGALESLDKEAGKLASMDWSHRPADRDVVLEFIDECKAMTRLASARVRLMVEESNAQKAYDQATKELNEATSTEREWRHKRFAVASDDLIAALQKKIDASKEAKGKVEKFLAADDAVKTAFGENKGLSKPVAEDFRKSISPSPPKGGDAKS
ncbi:hypothetical protein [Pseudomonas sp. IPO3774]|uniref:hypothetical protein n=1 Tax=Pseudomonas sp. IPO3774 TaxID=2738826 RepID=UPI0015A1B506|nr:hypothetical protein [Pseudomonas sp. IPO3774]NWD65758.1 hypothetical protein [Pseudomonas sp. IPO3774]